MKIQSKKLQTGYGINKRVTRKSDSFSQDKVVLGSSSNKLGIMEKPLGALKSGGKDHVFGHGVLGGMGGLIIGLGASMIGASSGIGGAIGFGLAAGAAGGLVNGIVSNNEFSVKDFAKGALAFGTVATGATLVGGGAGMLGAIGGGITSGVLLGATKENPF